MPEWWVGDANGTKRRVSDPWVGDSSGVKRRVEKAWVGDSGGVPRLFFQRSVPVSLSFSGVSWSGATLSWTSAGSAGVSYRLTRNGSAVYSGSALSFTDSGLSASTSYTYQVEALSGAEVLSSASVRVSTPARPQVAKDTGALLASSAGSYSGWNVWTLRERDNRLFIGYTYAERGYKDQHSGALFSVPADVRGCIAVTSVQVSLRVQYAPYAPDDWGLVVMTNTGWGGSWPGSSAQFVYLRCSGRDTWLGDREWVDITGYQVPGWGATVAEAFRSHGATGIGLAPHTNDSLYGYVNYATASDIRPRLRITYTVWG